MFEYTKTPFPLESYNDAFVVQLDSNVSNEEELFQDLFENLNFPDYFGYNWDALYDLLRDFHWMKQEEIILYYDGVPKLELPALKVYFSILAISNSEWQNDPKHTGHSLRVIFSESSKEEISKIRKKNIKNDISSSHRKLKQKQIKSLGFLILVIFFAVLLIIYSLKDFLSNFLMN